MAGRVLTFCCVIVLLALVPSCSQNAQLSSIEITPASVSFETNVPPPFFQPTDSTAQLTAIGTYTNGKNMSTYTKDITNQVDWSSSLESVATVTPAGVVSPTGCGVGVVKAQAGTGGVFADIAINVCKQSTSGSLGSLSSLKVKAPSQALKNGGDKAQYFAVGTYASNVTKDLTGEVKWSTSDARVATVSSTGLVTLVAPCSNIGSGPEATITAAAPEGSGSSLTATSTIKVGSCSAN